MHSVAFENGRMAVESGIDTVIGLCAGRPRPGEGDAKMHQAVEAWGKAGLRMSAQHGFFSGHRLHNDYHNMGVVGQNDSTGSCFVLSGFIHLTGGFGVDEFYGMVAVVHDGAGALEEGEHRVKTYLVKVGVAAKDGILGTQGRLVGEVTAHARKPAQQQHRRHGYSPCIGHFIVEVCLQHPPVDQPSEEPPPHGNDQEDKEVEQVCRLAEYHVDDHRHRLVHGQHLGVEPLEEVAKIGYVGRAGEKGHRVEHHGNVVRGGIIPTPTDTRQFAYDNQQQRQGEDVGAHGGVEAEPFPQGRQIETARHSLHRDQ